jgi:hypothetical protein
MRIASYAAAAALALVATPAAAQQLGFGTMAQGTLGYSMGAAISKVLSEKAGLQARVQPASGTTAYMPLLDRGELDLGVANIVEAREAASGTGPFEGRKLANVRVAAVLFPFRVGLFVRKDSPMKTVADLKGARVPYGFSAQATIATIMDAIMINGGVTKADIKPVLVPNVVRGNQDFIAGKADASFFALGAGQVQEANAALGGVRFLQMFDTPAAVAAMQKLVPESFIVTAEPAPGLAGVEAPTKVMAYDYVLLVGKHVKDETVEKIVATLAANKPMLVETLAAFRGFDAAKMAKKLPVEYHPGAVAAYTKLGHWPPK